MVRNNKGQFPKGSSGNPKGRPKKTREQRYYEITLTTCTYEDWQAIVQRAIADAKKGDQAARKWLADYLIGIPDQTLNVKSDQIVVKLKGND